jgi:hypothetical protein
MDKENNFVYESLMYVMLSGDFQDGCASVKPAYQTSAQTPSLSHLRSTEPESPFQQDHKVRLKNTLKLEENRIKEVFQWQ